MKGIIFTEFLDMVEERFSVETAEEILEAANLASGGSYTTLGTYSHAEILDLVTHLGKVSGKNVEELVMFFGEYLFGRFAAVHGEFFTSVISSMDFMPKVENYIHIEVQKLYAEAQPPQLNCQRLSDDRMALHYKSHRPLAALCQGLIQGCANWFGETVDITREDLPGSGPGTEAKFLVIKQA
ncbi:MAG: heme NO-binding domain-containing protein [Endozoicomonas sp.]